MYYPNAIKLFLLAKLTLVSLWAVDIKFNIDGEFAANTSTADSPATEWFQQNSIGLEDPGPGASGAVNIGPSYGNQTRTANGPFQGWITWSFSIYFFHSGVDTSNPLAAGMTTDNSNTFVGLGSPQHSLGFLVESDSVGLQRSDGSTSTRVFTSTFSSNLTAGNWYQMSFTATPVTSGDQFLRFSNMKITNSDSAGTLGTVFHDVGSSFDVEDTGNITLDPVVYLYVGMNSGSSGPTILDNMFTTAPIPEPSTYAMLIGLGALVCTAGWRYLLRHRDRA